MSRRHSQCKMLLRQAAAAGWPTASQLRSLLRDALVPLAQGHASGCSASASQQEDASVAPDGVQQQGLLLQRLDSSRHACTSSACSQGHLGPTEWRMHHQHYHHHHQRGFAASATQAPATSPSGGSSSTDPQASLYWLPRMDNPAKQPRRPQDVVPTGSPLIKHFKKSMPPRQLVYRIGNKKGLRVLPVRFA